MNRFVLSFTKEIIETFLPLISSILTCSQSPENIWLSFRHFFDLIDFNCSYCNSFHYFEPVKRAEVNKTLKTEL